MEYDVESAVSRFRNATAELLDALPGPGPFRNPGEGCSVAAEEFLAHLDLDRPAINGVLREAYPYVDHVPGLKEEAHARVRFVAWKALKGFRQLAPAYRRLVEDVGAQRLLGFRDGVPCYDTFREFLHERLSGCVHDRLLAALLAEQRRQLPTLGATQVQDATPLEARRREEEAPYSPHYGVRMMKLELRWDTVHEALLAQQFYDGLANEGEWLPALTARLQQAGLRAGRATVDGGYPSFRNIALQWRSGHALSHRPQAGWAVDPEAALEDVQKRYQSHWRHPAFRADAPHDAKLRFLVDHGTEHDVDAVGRYLRDAYLSTRTTEEAAFVRSQRALNEALNGEIKRLPLHPAKRGTRELLRRSQACTLTLHLVQLTRLQHGVTAHLCRTANLL